MPVVKIAQGDADSRYRQVVEQIKQAIRAGSLLPDTRLASVRTLAAQYGISLTTALKALRTLEDEHYAVAKPKSGFFVVSRKEYMQEGSVVVGQTHELAPLEEQIELHMAMVGENCRVRLYLANGDISLYPIKKLGLIMRQLGWSKPSLLGDMVKGTGCTPLKAEIVRRAVDYGCNINPDNILITNGCVEALSLSLRATVTAGDFVAVEFPCYFVLLQMLRDLNLREIEVDACKEGYVDSKKLVALFRENAVKVFFTLANINNPLGKSIPNEVKSYIARQADENGVIIIKDNIFGDAAFGKQRPFPIRAFSPHAILCSGFSKTVAPGIRIGWVHRNNYIRKIMSLKYTSSMGLPILSQSTIGELLRNGGYDVHLRKLRYELASQIRKIRHMVIREFPEGTKVSEPEGGYVLWVEMPQKKPECKVAFYKSA